MTTRRELADALRALAMDAAERDRPGHPGMPMVMANLAQVLWSDHLRFNPCNPHWPNRDRFVLSDGEGLMLHRALLDLSGFDLSIGELKGFRQLHSKTAGHPKAGMTPGVEITTGPRGHGLANAVGFALAEKVLAARFNRPGYAIVDHHTYVFLGGGCLMEGVSHEMASLAGTWQLGKLVAIYDDHGTSIAGEVGGSFTNDTPARFEAYGWQVIRDVDGHDADAINAALKQATGQGDQPVLICARTVIGFGAPRTQGSEENHGAALGHEDIVAVRAQLDWNDAPFEIPDAIRAGWNAREAGARREQDWNQALEAYTQAHPDLAAELKRRLAGDLPADWARSSQAFIARLQQDGPEVAPCRASQMVLDAFGPLLPELLPGSSDRAGASLAPRKGRLEAGPGDSISGRGNEVHCGRRGFGMSAMTNGLAVHGGFIPYDATSLVLSDDARSAVRMSALIPARAIYVFTYDWVGHDSIGQDSIDWREDGSTLQPVEHLAALRYIPNNRVWRPCDAVESAVSWAQTIERRVGPSCLVFARQVLKHQQRSEQQLNDIRRGGYVLFDPLEAHFVAILIATGSEVELAMEAARTLAQQGVPVRVVSMPCTDAFDAQPLEYREGVLPLWCRARVAVEAATADFWRKYVGLDGEVIGMSGVGESTPASIMFEHMGTTPTQVVDAVRRVLG